MNKNSEFFTKFLDEKFIPLDPKIKIAIAVVLAILPLVVFYFLFYTANVEQQNGLENQKVALNKELQDVKSKSKDLPKFEKELQQAESQFGETSALLPKDKEIPKLLTDISSLGRTAGLEFLTFKPMPDIPKDFYSEIPISLNIRGPYHNVGFFFDQVSKLERIVTVSNVKMGTPKKEGAEMILQSNCQLVTYRFTNVQLPKPTTK
jgi:type IV pilus assembly protein PilO